MLEIHEFKERLIDNLMNPKNVIADMAKNLCEWHGDGWWLCGKPSEIIFVAHIDTVKAKDEEPLLKVTELLHGRVLKNPNGILGGDDRVGVTILEALLNHHGATVLFTDLEEKGGIGAKNFSFDFTPPIHEPELAVYLDKCKMFIEFDRHGSMHYVDYCSMPKETERFILSVAPWLDEEFGSYSDISTITDATKIPSCNIACGFYNEHTVDETVSVQDAYAAYLIGIAFEERKSETPRSEDKGKSRSSYSYSSEDYYSKLYGTYGRTETVTALSDLRSYNDEDYDSAMRGRTSGSLLDLCDTCGDQVAVLDECDLDGSVLESLCEDCSDAYFDETLAIKDADLIVTCSVCGGNTNKHTSYFLCSPAYDDFNPICEQCFAELGEERCQSLIDGACLFLRYNPKWLRETYGSYRGLATERDDDFSTIGDVISNKLSKIAPLATITRDDVMATAFCKVCKKPLGKDVWHVNGLPIHSSCYVTELDTGIFRLRSGLIACDKCGAEHDYITGSHLVNCQTYCGECWDEFRESTGIIRYCTCCYSAFTNSEATMSFSDRQWCPTCEQQATKLLMKEVANG